MLVDRYASNLYDDLTSPDDEGLDRRREWIPGLGNRQAGPVEEVAGDQSEQER